ncbi:histidine kinase family protein [Oleiphilus messinensis]|uniref:Histidine kinase family protein n=1 Tax=Oleiphilus messinensis TaxID=141451 RepID=A0A1Y0IEL4_9GAMM|nr:histidine kinase family protein [Oleiphilus messinensis]
MIWPGLNLFIIFTVLYFLDLLTPYFFLLAAVKIWGVFLTGYILFNIIEQRLKAHLTVLMDQYAWLLRPVVIIFLFSFVAPIVDISAERNLPTVKSLPLFIMLFEILIYVAVMYILQQQEAFYQSRLQMQQTELQMLKMQSNPHFLFNALNLIASEVTTNPVRAKELIYDLSDLLRTTIRHAQVQWTTLEEELHLIELYLLLQQKRFEDRLTFDVDCPSNLNTKPVPSLLLLPVVENAIKYGVAPYAKDAHVSINVELHNGYFEIEVQDTGESFDDQNIQHGEGLRILFETLKLHFSNNFSIKLSSSNEGGCMNISFPEVDPKTLTESKK